MFYGIRGRLAGTYLLVITLTVVVLEVVIIYTVNTYYMDSVESYMHNQAEAASNLYGNYLANTPLESNINKILDYFSGLPVQTQIIRNDRKVIADSIHSTYGKTLDTPDITKALAGNLGKYSSKDLKTGERILSYSAPLKSRNSIEGAVRFSASLENTYNAINKITLYLVLVGAAIILLIFLISIYISRTIVNPLNKIIGISDEMAKGNLSVRIKKEYNDEIGVLSDSLNRMAEEIQKNDRIKNEFISSISHEIRTPLTSIKGWTKTLMDTEPDDTKVIARGIEIINGETDRLTDMVEELLDFSRLQSGKFSLQIETVELNDLVCRVYDQMNQRAIRQGIKMEIETLRQVILTKADPKRLKQVLINLIDNSLKYTSSGGVIQIALCIKSIDNEGFCEITVKDTGRGIDEKELSLIRERFFRGCNVSNTSGLGMGLSICDELIKSHGGSMSIQSNLNEGTCVSFLIPIKN